MKNVQLFMKVMAVCFLFCVGLMSLPAFKSEKKAAKVITIKNGTKFRVDMVYLSPVEDDHWGEDILDDNEVLEPNEEVDVEVTGGEWDAKMVAVDGSSCVVKHVKLCDAKVWVISPTCH